MRRTYVLMGDDWVERKRDKRGRVHYVMPDIQPYKSMIDGRIISSRSEHRAHLQAHGCIEIGNENPLKHGAKKPSPDRRREVLRAQLANMTHREANRLLERLRDDIRFTRNPHRE